RAKRNAFSKEFAYKWLSHWSILTREESCQGERQRKQRGGEQPHGRGLGGPGSAGHRRGRHALPSPRSRCGPRRQWENIHVAQVVRLDLRPPDQREFGTGAPDAGLAGTPTSPVCPSALGRNRGGSCPRLVPWDRGGGEKLSPAG